MRYLRLRKAHDTNEHLQSIAGIITTSYSLHMGNYKLTPLQPHGAFQAPLFPLGSQTPFNQRFRTGSGKEAGQDGVRPALH